ncbi:hypothetical protein EDC01DRAFT_651175, partial [Geopyxis carbonaria]
MYESQVFRTLDASLPEDAWPLFELTNVTVVRHPQSHTSPNTPIDYLDVGEFGPFRVTGTLTPLSPAVAKTAVNHQADTSAMYTTPHVLPRLYTYSIESFGDNTPLKIWLLGQAGWYGLSPSRAYRPIFEKGLEKARIWSFLEDWYLQADEEEREGRCDTVEELCAEYSEREETCKGRVHAQSLFMDHHRYLLFKMLETEDMRVTWMATPLYTYYSQKYADEIVEIRSILTRQKKKHEVDRINDLTPSDNEEEVEDVPEPLWLRKPKGSAKKGKKTPKKETPKSKETPKTKETAKSKETTKSKVKQKSIKKSITPIPIKLEPPFVKNNCPSNSIFSTLENSICARPNSGQVDLADLVDVFFQNYAVESVDVARTILEFYAEQLCWLMQKSNRYPWDNRRVFRELSRAVPPKSLPARLRNPKLAPRSPPPKIKQEPQLETVILQVPKKSVRVKREPREPMQDNPGPFAMARTAAATTPAAKTGKTTRRSTAFCSTTAAMSDSDNDSDTPTRASRRPPSSAPPPKSRLRPLRTPTSNPATPPAGPTPAEASAAKARLDALKRKMDASMTPAPPPSATKRRRTAPDAPSSALASPAIFPSPTPPAPSASPAPEP